SGRSKVICWAAFRLDFFLLTVSTSAAGLLRNGRRNTTTRRALVHPVNCNTSSLPCHPCPASTQSSLLKICPMSFFTFPLCLSLNIQVQHHPDIGYEVTMIGVRRASRLSRVISHLGVLLMSVQWLHGAIHISDPRLLQQRFIAGLQMLLQPPSAVPLVHGLHGPPHRVLARHLGHSQQLRIHAVGPDRVDVGVPPM